VEVTPRESRIAVSVDLTGSGLERRSVYQAQAAVKDKRSNSKAGDQFWELSGLLFCGECGRRMIAYRRTRQHGYYHYYRCRPGSTLANCSNRNSHRAEQLDHDAAATFERYANRGTLLELYDRTVEEQEKRMGLCGSLERRAALGENFRALTRTRRGFQEQQAEGLMTIANLRERLEELDEEREQIAGELHATEDATSVERQIWVDRESLLSADWFEDPDGPQPWGCLSISASPKEVHRAYRKDGARFELSADGTLALRLKLDLAPEPLQSEYTCWEVGHQVRASRCSRGGCPASCRR
jgi:hypothetical protein